MFKKVEFCWGLTFGKFMFIETLNVNFKLRDFVLEFPWWSSPWSFLSKTCTLCYSYISVDTTGTVLEAIWLVSFSISNPVLYTSPPLFSSSYILNTITILAKLTFNVCKLGCNFGLRKHLRSFLIAFVYNPFPRNVLFTNCI